MICANDLTYIYPHHHLVFQSVTFTVNEGEFWGVLGKNGAGKTTLIDLFLGLKYPSHGDLRVAGVHPRERHRGGGNDVAFLSQDIHLKGDITVQDFLDFNSFFFREYSKHRETELTEYFRVEPTSLIGALSTGQQKKVQIVAALAARTKLIIIDEITAVLDPEARFLFFEKLRDLNETFGTTILLATNIAEDLETRADKILYLNEHNGEVYDPLEIKKLFHIEAGDK